MSVSILDERLPLNSQTFWVNATPLGPTSVGGFSNVGGRVDALLATNTDAVAHVVSIYVTNASHNYLLGSVSVPAGAGVAGAASVDLLASLPITAQGGLIFSSGAALELALDVHPLGVTEVAVSLQGGYF